MKRKVERRERARQMKYRKDRESARSSCSTLDPDLDSLGGGVIRHNEMKSSTTTATTAAASLGNNQYRGGSRSGIQEEVKEDDFDYIIEEVDGYLNSIREQIADDLNIIGELNTVEDSDG